jgi:hypothetical protein
MADETKLTTDLKAALCVGYGDNEAYEVVVQLVEGVSSTFLNAYGRFRTGGSDSTVSMHLTIDLLSRLTREPAVESVSLSHHLRAL